MPRHRSAFARALADCNPAEGTGRTWVFVPYDQLSDRLGTLSRLAPEAAGIVVVENPWKAAQRPYHRQKIALVLANLRQFALEQAERGVAVRHVVADGPYRDALRPLAEELGPLTVMEPAERELRTDLAPLVEAGLLTVTEHEGWLTTPEQFRRHTKRGHPPWRMDAFYRLVRQETGILMDDSGQPVGGKLSHDADNREPWSGEPEAAEPPRFTADPITAEVVALVETQFARHPGRLDPTALPATRRQATALWTWAKKQCLAHFGPYEDAMSTRSTTLFHTRISALVHLHRLLPRQVVDDALALDIPLNSKEGFVRQVLGWREFVRHVHRETDGLRSIPGRDGARRRIRVLDTPGDGGWSTWSGEDWTRPEPNADPPAGGAVPAKLGATRPVPPAFWGATSGLHCLDTVVRSVWDEAYGHHITRLMVLSNLATLLDLDARELTDWFWVAYADAFDWVVEPNVLGMGTYAVGELFTTKPYVSGAAYIHKMSDYCRDCRFDPKKTCPITSLYWAFLGRQRDALAGNVRIAMPLKSQQKRTAAQQERDAQVFEAVSAALAAGEELTPRSLEAKVGAATRQGRAR